MAIHEQRLLRLRAHVGDARDELHALPAGDRKAFESELAQLEEVVADAVAVLDAADARLVPSRAFASVQAAASAIANDPRAALHAPDAHADALVDALTLLPVTRMEIAQHVLTRLGADVEQWRAQIELQCKRQDTLDRKLAEAETAVAAHARTLDEHLARQREAFAETERARAAAFEAQLELFRGELARAQQEAADEVGLHVVELRRMEQESAKLVGTLGAEGTAEFYGRQARRQRRAAEVLRGLAVVAVLAAVAIALAGAVAADQTAGSLVSGLFASLLLTALAAYIARQSARHRACEERASAIQLELAAFGPFIEPLSAERREEERVIMARKLFGDSPIDGASRTAVRRSDDGAADGESNGIARRRSAASASSAAANGAGTNGSRPL